MNQPKITILPAPNCRRSRKVLAFLHEQNIPFEQVTPDSPEGQRLQAKYHLRASPGILVNGVSVNPYDILIQEQCRVDQGKALALFQADERNE